MALNLLDTGRTDERITCDCGEAFGVSVYRIINLASDPQALDDLLAGRLNLVRCPSCSRQFPSDTPVNLHDHRNSRYLCLFPSAWRSRELDLRIQFFQELLGQGTASIPGYVRDARFVFGIEACGKALGREPQPSVQPAGPTLPVAAEPQRRTRVQELQESDFEQVRDVESVDRRDAALVQRWKESGQSHYTFLDDGALHIFQRHPEPDGFSDRADIFFQLHRIENFPLIVLLLVAESKSGPPRVLYWLFNLDNKVDVKFLEQLALHFDVRLHLFDLAYGRKRVLVFSPSLEQNVQYVLDEAREWLQGIEPGRRNFFIAASKFDESGYDKLGRKMGGLDASVFNELPSPAVAKLALEILTYWSSKQNYEYLIFIKSFPVASFKAIVAGVLRRAIHFGLTMSEKMKRMAVEMQLADSKEALVQTLLQNFSEVAVGLRQNDLDPQSLCENWRQLLQDAQELGCSVDPEQQHQAQAAERRLVEARQAIPLDLADDVEMLGTLGQLKTAELLPLLKEKDNRAEAARVLAETGSAEVFGEVAGAFGRMSRQEIDVLGDALGAFGEVARDTLVRAADGSRSAQVVGALRALARLDGPASSGRLIREVAAGRRGVWREAAVLLQRLPEVPAQVLDEASKNPDASVRARLTVALGGMRNPKARALLQGMASSDPDSHVQAAARRALQRMPEGG